MNSTKLDLARGIKIGVLPLGLVLLLAAAPFVNATAELNRRTRWFRESATKSLPVVGSRPNASNPDLAVGRMST